MNVSITEKVNSMYAMVLITELFKKLDASCFAEEEFEAMQRSYSRVNSGKFLSPQEAIRQLKYLVKVLSMDEGFREIAIEALNRLAEWDARLSLAEISNKGVE